MVKMSINELTSELTQEELLDLETAEGKPVTYDEDSPEMTPEMLMQFKRMNKEERINKQSLDVEKVPMNSGHFLVVLKRSRKIYMIAVSFNCNRKICHSRAISTVRAQFQ